MGGQGFRLEARQWAWLLGILVYSASVTLVLDIQDTKNTETKPLIPFLTNMATRTQIQLRP